jgi:hypothetical protein
MSFPQRRQSRMMVSLKLSPGRSMGSACRTAPLEPDQARRSPFSLGCGSQAAVPNASVDRLIGGEGMAMRINPLLP